ncbi:glycosyltransferase [Leifsonia sp. RAF41]|uniref:glycosyltransferase n=1 Tax=Leifsonia sp. RAF41 TaxID=3233056 RepID=UPI003F96A951
MLSFFQSVSLILTVLFLTYVVMIVVPYLRHKPSPEGDADAFEWHAFIPCRDEQSVIGTTITRARATFPNMHVWVVDDDSEDDTARIVQSHADHDPFVHLVQRRRPQARTGKGDALNAAYAQLDDWLPEGTDRAGVIVVVVDADGELAANALTAVAAEDVFADPEVGAAQVTVWMKNRGDRTPYPGRNRIANGFASWLLRLQDVEFRTVILAMQALRSKTGTVGMGGNGQFTRLSVLDAVHEHYGAPWHGSLLEDYELGLHVIFAGYQNRQVDNTHVSQEALPSLPRFITQRGRWAQGVMQCVKYLPQILRSRQFDAAGALEAAYFLTLPFVQIVGFFAFFALVIGQAYGIATDPVLLQGWLQNLWGLLAIGLVFGIGPFMIWGPIYKIRCEPDISWPHALWIGVSVWLFQFYVMVSIFKACFRIIRRRNGWAKTRRNADVPAAGTIAIEN